jgi:hypothetical protein
VEPSKWLQSGKQQPALLENVWLGGRRGWLNKLLTYNAAVCITANKSFIVEPQVSMFKKTFFSFSPTNLQKSPCRAFLGKSYI